MPFVASEDLIVLKALWSRAKDIADIQALAACAAFDRAYVTTTLRALLPEDDPRHARVAALLARRP